MGSSDDAPATAPSGGAAGAPAVHPVTKAGQAFLSAQLQVVLVLALAFVGDRWTPSYPRNDNHKPYMFWAMNAVLLVAAVFTLEHDPNASSRGVQLLSRPQTEEWKGWMQWAFIMYHYYRMYAVYNEIRVFVSAYVWMTGFGNFLYFSKKKDFSLERAVSMWIRINYFPLVLSYFLDVPLELYYVVPLHTAGFFITMATCYLAELLEPCTKQWTPSTRHFVAIMVCLFAHVGFYETTAVDFLLRFGKEYHFRFQADKYSAWVGIFSAYFWNHFKVYMQWCYNTPAPNLYQTLARWTQRVAGVVLIGLWYSLFGHLQDKYVYNPMHPYIFWLPVAGWLLVRNSSKYLCELHSHALEFFGRITLETYVLQFHLFMSHKVQHIPVVIPGANADASLVLQTANMLLCGSIFVATAFWARQITVQTQTSVTDLLTYLRYGTLLKTTTNNNNNKPSSDQQQQKPLLLEVPPSSNGSHDPPTTKQQQQQQGASMMVV